MTARRTLVLLPLVLFAAAAQAHPGHDPEGLHRLIHALADLDPRIAGIAVVALVAGLLAWRQRSATRGVERRPMRRER